MSAVASVEASRASAAVNRVEIRARVTGFLEAVLFREGDPVDAFYIVHDGLVTVFRDQEGKPQQVLARLEEGGFFGEMGLFLRLADRAPVVVRISIGRASSFNRAPNRWRQCRSVAKKVPMSPCVKKSGAPWGP